MDAQPDDQAVATQKFLQYNFDADETYKQGLAGILGGSALDEATLQDVLLRSRVFYFNRISGSSLTVDDVRERVQTGQALNSAVPAQSTASRTESSAEEPRVLSFAELKELIEQGKTDQIPNNRVIPNELSTEAPSVSTAPPRKKPWEA